ncbi:hypothetical protein D9M71_362050 [compost metagenome]
MPRRAAEQRALQVVQRQLGHRLARLVGGRAHVRQGHHVGQGEQRRLAQRFLLVDVEAGGADLAVLQRLDQRRLVHHRAAGDVDQDGARLHQRQLAAADQVAGLRAERHHQHHEVGLAEQLVEAAVARAQFLLQRRLAAVAAVQHLHVETEAPAAGDGRADVA